MDYDIKNTPIYIKGFRDGYAEGYAEGVKAKNGTTSKGLDIPEPTDRVSALDCMENMKMEFDKLWDSWTILRGKLCQVEKRVSNNREDINTIWDRCMNESNSGADKSV